jgi:4-amino-4-deoxy-L-arabinose transferase-like glycosyltransferase/sugar lactone lactonase YvrE
VAHNRWAVWERRIRALIRPPAQAGPTLDRGEVGLLIRILAAALLIRVFALGTFPGNITADEADNLQFAFHVRAGMPPGFFGFDWKPQPMFSVWLMAQVMRVFGWSVFGMRLTSAVLSVAALVPFYFLARRQVSRLAAVAATLMLASNLWYLHFSRSGWENVHVALYALGAAYCVLRGLDTRYWVYWALAGVFCALGQYGYFSGRLIIIGVLAFLPFAILQRRAEWKRVLVGYYILLIVAAVLYAPQAWSVYRNQALFSNRTNSVYVLRDVSSVTEGAQILASQVALTLRGFLLIDPYLDYKSRYNPPQQGVLDLPTTALYMIGLVVSLAAWRDTSIWWCIFVVGIGVTQVFASGTPDGARAVGYAPFMFLFVAMGLQAIIGRMPSRMTFGAVAILCLLSVSINLFGYVAWMSQESTLDARKPAIEFDDFQSWQEAQMADIRAGKRGFDVQQWTPGLGLGAPKPATLDRKGQALDPQGVNLGEPRGVAADANGNLYVADPKGARIIRLATSSSLTASWMVDPDATPPAEPWDLAIDPTGMVWVLDASGRGLIRYNAEGQVLARIGQELGLFRPRGMTIDSVGRLYIADTGHGRVLQLDPMGNVLLSIGATPGGVLSQPSDVAVAADGSIFVAEPEQGKIHKLDAKGDPVGSVLINRTNTLDGYHLAVDDRLNLLVLSDPGGGRVDFYRLDLSPVGFADGIKGAPAALQVPSGVALFQGRAYATEVRQGRVVAYDVNELKP